MFKAVLVYLFGDAFRSAQEIKFEQARAAKAIRLKLELDNKRIATGYDNISKRG